MVSLWRDKRVWVPLIVCWIVTLWYRDASSAQGAADWISLVLLWVLTVLVLGLLAVWTVNTARRAVRKDSESRVAIRNLLLVGLAVSLLVRFYSPGVGGWPLLVFTIGLLAYAIASLIGRATGTKAPGSSRQ